MVIDDCKCFVGSERAAGKQAILAVQANNRQSVTFSGEEM
jgi:hypothetical protein